MPRAQALRAGSRCAQRVPPARSAGADRRQNTPGTAPAWKLAVATFKKILVPVDFPEHSTVALDTAAARAKQCDASLTIIHVYEPLAIAVPEGYQLFSEDQLHRIFQELQREL